jgi:hypothetical protein
MAGLAEAAWQAMICLLWIGILLVGVLIWVSLGLRSRIAAACSLIVDLMLLWFFMPWEAFSATSNDDPDWQHWLGVWRIAATTWAVVSVAAIVSAIWTFLRNDRQSAQTPSVQSEPHRAT